MNYRQREAVRFEQLLWLINEAGRTGIDFLSNKYILSLTSQDFVHVLALELLQVSM